MISKVRLTKLYKLKGHICVQFKKLPIKIPVTFFPVSLLPRDFVEHN